MITKHENGFDKIKISDKLDGVAKSAIKSAKKDKKRNKIRLNLIKYGTGIASIFIIFVVSVNYFQTFADSIKNVPIFCKIAAAVSTNNNGIFVPKIKHEVITDQNKIKSTFPVKEEKPTIDLGDLKQVSTEAENDTYNPDFPQYITNTYRIMTVYKSPSGKELIITQGNSEDNADGPLPNIVNKTSTAKVKGVDAAICEAKNGYTQVVFIKNKKFYNIMGYKMSKVDLIKIAESLQ